ncbi:phosphopyruvate hydratase [Patescibacteria group bacterium]
MTNILQVRALEILDSRGNPTVMAEAILEDGTKARSGVPSGASTGVHEALELRDGDQDRYLGKGVQKACDNVNNIISPELRGMDVTDQEAIDNKMLELDGTENKSKLGANAILAASLACLRVAAKVSGQELYEYLAEDTDSYELPMPLINIINGGQHADSGLAVQEFKVVPVGAKDFKEAMEISSEIFHALEKILSEKGYATGVGNEGGFAPHLENNQMALEVIIQAIEKSGHKPGEQVAIALDTAASEFYKDGFYMLEDNTELTAEQLVNVYAEWITKYPIISIEDGCDQDDWDGWELLYEKLGSKIQIMGDDLTVTNIKRIREAHERGVINSVLLKLNQIGTVTETKQAIDYCKANNLATIISHRSGETCDSSIADLAVGWRLGQIKSGSTSRSERLAKYNRLLEIHSKTEGKNTFFHY